MPSHHDRTGGFNAKESTLVALVASIDPLAGLNVLEQGVRDCPDVECLSKFHDVY